MKILFIGDVVGSCGRSTLEKHIDSIVDKYNIQIVIMNGENATHGRGISMSAADELFGMGVDIITTGNHVWGHKDIFTLIESNKNIIRPANLPKSSPGNGSVLFEKNGCKIGVISLLGRVYMDPCDCPFAEVDRQIEILKKNTNVIILDFHAEATSEKVAMGWYLDGRASAVIGTHTHVQTADEKILPKKCAYISDAGMTGAYYSVLGMERKVIIDRFTKRLPQKFELADGAGILSGVVLDIDAKTGSANSINRIMISDSQ